MKLSPYLSLTAGALLAGCAYGNNAGFQTTTAKYTGMAADAATSEIEQRVVRLISTQGKHTCFGFILKKDTIVTDAHCMTRNYVDLISHKSDSMHVPKITKLLDGMLIQSYDGTVYQRSGPFCLDSARDIGIIKISSEAKFSEKPFPIGAAKNGAGLEVHTQDGIKHGLVGNHEFFRPAISYNTIAITHDLISTTLYGRPGDSGGPAIQTIIEQERPVKQYIGSTLIGSEKVAIRISDAAKNLEHMFKECRM